MLHVPVIWILTVSRMRMDIGVQSDGDTGARLGTDKSVSR